MLKEKINNSYYKELYNKEEYFLSERIEGYEEYRRGDISHLKKIEIDLLRIGGKDRFLDIGCGRGEVASHVLTLTDHVAAIDVSEAAVRLTNSICRGRACVIQALATDLPFEDNYFDKILVGDIIEHLTYEDSCKMLNEIKRILGPDGTLLIHTSPNANFMKIIYPIAYLMVRIMRPAIAAEIKDQVRESKIDHLNEYSPRLLIKQCREIGFKCNYKWTLGLLRDSKNRLTSGISDNSLFKVIDQISKLPAIRNFLVNDLFLICNK